MKVPRWQSMLAAYRVRVPPRSRSWLPVSSRSPAWVHSWTGGIRPCTGIAQTASCTAQTLLPLFGILCGCWFSGSIFPRLPAYDRGKVLRTSLSIGDPSRSREPVCPRSWAHVPTHTSTPIPPPRTPTPLFLGTCPIADDIFGLAGIPPSAPIALSALSRAPGASTMLATSSNPSANSRVPSIFRFRFCMFQAPAWGPCQCSLEWWGNGLVDFAAL